MAIGYHNYPLAVVVSGIVVITLFVLEPVQRFINRFHKVKDYRIKPFRSAMILNRNWKFFTEHDMDFRCMKTVKEDADAVYMYRISSPDRDYDAINHFLLNHKEVRSFEV